MSTGITIFEITLHDPGEEEELLAWWDGVRALVTERFRAGETGLAVAGRGRYIASVGFPLPGTWKLVTRDRRWAELERRRPAGDVKVTQARRWHRTGQPRDVTTTELQRLVQEGGAVLVDARSEDAYELGHIPGAVSLPNADPDEQRIRAIVGDDRERTIVAYCSGYG